MLPAKTTPPPPSFPLSECLLVSASSLPKIERSTEEEGRGGEGGVAGQVGEERGLGEFGRSRVYGVVGAAVWCVEADVREIGDCELYAGRARVESGKFFVFLGGG